ncbi:hypothetical protein VNO77_30701 [Canavalia gladiata]|uniref:Uncharacterized protein n=1 Tax=Canavalia gladiata TaxID=3824 RepID=A0AAN9KRC9_CANGL
MGMHAEVGGLLSGEGEEKEKISLAWSHESLEKREPKVKTYCVRSVLGKRKANRKGDLYEFQLSHRLIEILRLAGIPWHQAHRPGTLRKRFILLSIAMIQIWSMKCN